MTTRDVYEFPATPTQKALWFLYRMDPTSAAYNIPLAFRVRGPLQEDALRQAFASVVARHEILRTVFAEREGSLVQIARDDLALDWRSETIERGADPDAFCTESAARHATHPFDLAQGPLLRVRLERFSDFDALLTMVFHHIVIDHISLAQFAIELGVLYRALSRGEREDLPEQELQFADYAIWLREHESQGELDRKLGVWKHRLTGFSGVLDLPLDNPRPAIQSNRGAELRFSLLPELANEAKRFARNEGVSLFVVMLSALKVLLHHYSRQEDIIVGVPFANRGDQEELERVVGCFINTLPVATDFSNLRDFRQLLQSVRSVMLESLDIQDVPLESIVETVKPRRDASHNPIFQVGFVLQAPPVALTLEGLDLEDLHAHSGGAMYDLHFWVWETGEGIDGLVWFNTTLYEDRTVRRMVEHYQHALSQLLARPAAPLESVSLLTPAEAVELAKWNATERSWPEASSVVDLFQQQARRTPAQWAVMGPRQRYSFAELDERSDHLASYLLRHGVRGGELVGIAIDRDADLLVGLLGILKAGAAYLPLDPHYPNERLRFMIENAEVKVLVSQQALIAALPAATCEKILLDGDWNDIERTQVADLPVLDPGQPMYVIYTSGSTGTPNAVQVTHRNVINLLRSMAERPGLAADDRLLAVTTLSFDIAVLELYLPLIVGGTTVVASREAVNDGHDLKQLLEQEKINVMQATPSTWRMLLGAGWKGFAGFKCLCGGEAFPPDLAEQLLAGNAQVWNMYGPTETTVWSTCFLVSQATPPIPLGKPIANTTCHVFNEHMRLVPPGLPGELYIGGEGVTQGYLNREDLTAQRFVRNPSGSGILYRTGDLARQRADGNLEYLDRIDRQVKVRGFRIELGEIEMALSRHTSIAQVAVLVREYSAADKRLVAYVRFDDGAQPTVSELRQHLREYLPDYMIPQLIVEVDAIPLTPSGKVDRKALPDPLEGAHREYALVAPRNGIEQRLSEIWQKVLNGPAISVDSNFFDIGGHSLLAMQAVFHIEEEFGVRLNPLDLIMNTLEQLAARLAAHETAQASEGPTIGLLGRVRERLGL